MKALGYARSIFNTKWMTRDYLTNGWLFFIREEALTIFILSVIMWVIDTVTGRDTCCKLLHLVLIVLIRRVMVGGICNSTKRLDGQTVVITGCNVGIGKETARALSQRGAKIIMACRNTKTAEKTALEISNVTGRELVVMKLDLASLSSIRAFAADLKKKESKIHILINNAGVMMCPFMKTEDGFEMQMGTNHLGHFLLTNLLLPLLSHGQPARIINVSSLASARGVIPFDDMNYEKGYNKVQAYGNSKLANVLFTRQLAKRLKGTSIQVFALHPGAVQSNLGRHFMGMWSASKLVTLFIKTTAEGAQTTIFCALEACQQEPHYFSDCAPGYVVSAAQDDEVAEKLWKVSEKMVGL
ncbi:hypothetical protein Pmani_033478 [Petrolisthes manimaculis]|uniref:Retinol dehydrogenase 11 n=1 Tax=Petrolisthes manimaculis TaxID=1843537 RepID=A0AAE1TSN6_9EUCA|nr:hypothetical protein Pmani_033478 [Petrolisthes manimaculis]